MAALSVIATAVVKAVVTAVVSTAINLAISSLTRPKRRGAPSIDTGPLASALSSSGPKRVVFGHTGVRGASLVANKRIGNTHHWVAIIADDPISEFVRVHIRGSAVTLDSNGWVTSGPWAEGGARTIRFTFYDGSQANVQPLIDLNLVEAGSLGRNTVIVHAEISYPQTDAFIKLFQGSVPDFIFEVRGIAVYDPTDLAQSATDASTWRFADEAILIQAAHQVHPLGRGRAMDDIDWADVARHVTRHRATVTSRAGDTDKRFSARGFWLTVVETHAEVEARIGAAHAGGLIDMPVAANSAGASRQRFYSSDPDTAAVLRVSGDDISESVSGPDDAAGIDVRPNAVRVGFPNRKRVWDPDSLVIRFDDLIAADGGLPRFLELELDTCDNHLQASLLGLLEFYRARYGQTWRGTFRPRLIPLQADDVITAIIPDVSLAGTERLRITSAGLNGDDQAELVIVRDDAAWHADPGALEPAEIELVTDQIAPTAVLAAPVVTATSGGSALTEVDGLVLPGILITVTGEAGVYAQATINIRHGTGEDQVEQSAAKQFDGAASVRELFGPLAPGTVVSYTVTVFASGSSRSQNVNGTHTVSGDQTAPAAPTGLTAVGGVGEVNANADAPQDADVDALIFARVIGGSPAPNLLSDSSRKIVSARPSENDVSTAWTGVSVGTWDVYAAALDRAGNLSAATPPQSVTVT